MIPPFLSQGQNPFPRDVDIYSVSPYIPHLYIRPRPFFSTRMGPASETAYLTSIAATLSVRTHLSFLMLVSVVFSAAPVVGVSPQAVPVPPSVGEIGVCPWMLAPSDKDPSPGPGYDDTSEFFVGSVAVGLFLVESNGHAYDWSDEEVAQTLEGIYGALSWWASMEPRANLSFAYELHIREPTSWEPIENPLADSHMWISEIMSNLGFAGSDARARVLRYNNDLRGRLGTDWAFSIFVADSDDNVNYGRFTDDQYACGYIGGPSFTMSRYSSWAYNSADYFRAVPAHETGHIFYATDEYDSDPLDFSGYLHCPDCNGAPGIMNRNTLTVSDSTRCQLGWVDSDGDGVLDVLDTPPQTRLDSYTMYDADEGRRQYAGTATAVARPNRNPRGPGNYVTISRITGVDFRIDDGPWTPAEAEDGAFGGPVESFYFVTPPLGSDTHTIEAQARDSAGQVDPTPAREVVGLDDVTPQNPPWILETVLVASVVIVSLLALIRHRRKVLPARSRLDDSD